MPRRRCAVAKPALRTAMETRRLTQTDLGAAAMLSAGSISKALGGRPLSIFAAARIAAAVGEPMKDLFAVEEIPDRIQLSPAAQRMQEWAAQMAVDVAVDMAKSGAEGARIGAAARQKMENDFRARCEAAEITKPTTTAAAAQDTEAAPGAIGTAEQTQ